MPLIHLDERNLNRNFPEIDRGPKTEKRTELVNERRSEDLSRFRSEVVTA